MTEETWGRWPSGSVAQGQAELAMSGPCGRKARAAGCAGGRASGKGVRSSRSTPCMGWGKGKKHLVGRDTGTRWEPSRGVWVGLPGRWDLEDGGCRGLSGRMPQMSRLSLSFGLLSTCCHVLGLRDGAVVDGGEEAA